MTDYGRGPAPQPWHTDDPLYGDPAGHSGQDGHSTGGWDPYQDHLAQQYPQAFPHQQAPYPQPQYAETYADQYADPGYQQAPYPPQYPDPGPAYWDDAPQRQQPYADPGPQAYPGWEQQPPADPYAGYVPQQEAYGTGYAEPHPQAPFHEQPVPEQAPEQGAFTEQPVHEESAVERTAEWQAFDDDADGTEQHPFFTGSDSGDDEADDDAGQAPATRREGRRERRRRGAGKRRSGASCLIAVVALGAVLGGGGWFGYRYYQNHIAPPPDYAGSGSGEVQVEIPERASIALVGNILKKDGVVKSVDAFTAAAHANPKGLSIQSGVYLLHQQMSASAAVAMMLSPSSQSTLTIPEGTRAVRVYTLIDEKLRLPAGSTAKVAHDQAGSLGLPDWATGDKIKDPLEGFLFPDRYAAAQGMKPQDVLKQMVQRATSQYDQLGVDSANASKLGLKSPLEVLTVASLVQAEGKTDDDFRKMSRVVYNRLDPANRQTFGILEFDSTYNYIKNQNSTRLSLGAMRALDDPYNTYRYKGLPPGPIDNPGTAAIKAALDPEPGNWYYFISLDGKTTQFTETWAEHEKLAKQYKG
ncbi:MULTISPECIES: endolytic transglycosylase MltG [Streptomycetaceae]|uniref:Endolytic murein transglycosylase n=1 Tax=Streptantibioticus cattleyicolor (strain ATCC 35852 / DSM 46488 / JCM 4925 / NBRC 14057 / NRRL 8057) TaxID=1003195 RepID=F8K4X4_STREN|nr:MULTISPECIES: endolytic transglycosylase MltG [Streptomycetaceae]AEW97693.1 integral membrane protein [Streptantibioticus cattleyicolor NRRL 8057 = DSM 46488]MYS62118.1 endolytic transglycosylase MltG [Streptomyces sp. SID5468]CCB78013.1 putative aminodeoxychorismate lyase [Streptantibioticus cattleyicolor NRRL 8057 = DSM 46488]